MKVGPAQIILALLLGTLLAPLSSSQAEQAKKLSRIGVLLSGSASSTAPLEEAFREELRHVGWVEGENIVIESRYAEGKLDQLSALAAELVQLKVEVIVVLGNAAIRAVKGATRTIPIVMTIVGDPVAEGFVDSLARPGGNITGFTSLETELYGKRLELLKDAFPKLSRIAVILQPDVGSTPANFKETQVAAKALGVQLQPVAIRSLEDLEPAFKAAAKGRADALIVLGSLLTNAHRQRIARLAEKIRLPAIYNDVSYVEAGGLMSYSASRVDIFRRAAIYVDKILEGTKPADLPVQQPMKFEFVINLRAAKAIGLTIPPNVLARADKVIK
jgi:putative ABC transport system substrate-binding protein